MVVSATFSIRYGIYFVISEDWKLYILKQNSLAILNKIPFDSKYNIGIIYQEQIESLICIAVDAIDYFYVNIETNIHQSKYLTNIKFNLKVDKKVNLFQYEKRNQQKKDWTGIKGILLTTREYSKKIYFSFTELRICMCIN